MQVMDDGAKGWLFKTAHKHYWRVCPFYDLEDLIQDGYLCYQRVYTRYCTTQEYRTDKGRLIKERRPEELVTERRHLMRLFQTTFLNHIHDLSKRTTTQLDFSISLLLTDGSDESDLYERYFPPDTDSVFQSTVLHAPEHIRKALALFGSEEGRAQLREAYKKIDGIRETFNERLCRLCGLNPRDINLASELQSYLRFSSDSSL